MSHLSVDKVFKVYLLCLGLAYDNRVSPLAFNNAFSNFISDTA